MYDVLPFPQKEGRTPDEKIDALFNYLVQLKETLEFILGDIGVDNLSKEVIDRLNGIQTEEITAETSDEILQIASKSLSVSDVVNSPIFKSSVQSEIGKLSINYETGYLEIKEE